VYIHRRFSCDVGETGNSTNLLFLQVVANS